MEIKIPEQLKDMNFVLIDESGDGKKPLQTSWQKRIHRINDPMLQNDISRGKNYGIQSNNSSIIINNKSCFILIIDFDKREFQDKVLEKFPKTFATSSGSSKNCLHLWFASDNNMAFKIKDEKLNTLADIIGAGNQVIGPGSKHNSGSIYHVVNDVPITFLPYAELEAILRPYDKSPKKKVKSKKYYAPKDFENSITENIYNSVSMKSVLIEVGIDISKNPTNCPFHSSIGGKCFSFNDEVAHCFDCNGSWNKFSLIREAKKLTDKETFEWFAEEAGMTNELEKIRNDWIIEKRKEKRTSANVFSRRGQIEEFWKSQPFFFDRNKIFWLWDIKLKKWVISDVTDYLNSIQKLLGIDTINSLARSELEAGFKQIGRLHIPEDIKSSWVQFKDKIYDITTGENFEATPKFFVTNSIPWKVGEFKEGEEEKYFPLIHKLFKSWVCEEDIPRLYELFAFVPVPKYFIHSFFFLYAPPGYGKSTFRNLLIKFIGKGNCVSTSIDRINKNIRFETKNWYRKLLITMDEVNNVYQLKNSSIINGATGEDPVPAEFKGSNNDFNFINYGKFIYPTNKLLKVDLSDGFGRRVRKIDFINRFEKEEDVIDKIPDNEFENLAKKSLELMKKLWDKRHFSGDLSISERMEKYQEDSKTPLERFIDKYYILADEEEKIVFNNFYVKLMKYYLENNISSESNIIIGKQLRHLGIENKNFNWKNDQSTLDPEQPLYTSKKTIFGLKVKEEI